MKGLEKFFGEFLEFRPYPRSYKLVSITWPICEAFYIGIRVKGGVKPKKKIIDLDITRNGFFDII